MPVDEAAEPKAAPVESDMEVESADPGPPEVPEWRQELSRRLQEIKSRRETAVVNFDPPEPETPAPIPEAPEPPPARPPAARRSRRIARFPERERASASTTGIEEQTPIPVETPREIQNGAESEAVSLPAADVLVRPPAAEKNDRQEIEKLIDAARMRYQPIEAVALPAEPVSKPTPPMNSNPEPRPEPEPKPAPMQEPQRKIEFDPPIRMRPEHKPVYVPESDLEPMWMTHTEESLRASEEPAEDKLILLTRTLAGLIDLIIVVLCAGSIILAADILEGIDIWDTVSQIHYAALFLTTYFVYSLFFLGMANQTIGMMLTDLRMVSGPITRASVMQILVRCCIFLFGVAALGIGLIWGIFDRQSRCLHDLLSRTRITRIFRL